MRIVLRADVTNVGKKGDIVDVADGFGRNFLVPKGLALKATAGAEAQAGSMRRSRDVKDARDREAAEAVARVLVPMVVKIPAKAGAEGRLFGSVTTADVAAAVHDQAGATVDRRRLHIGDPIKTLGSHSVQVRLHADVEFSLTVEVVALK